MAIAFRIWFGLGFAIAVVVVTASPFYLRRPSRRMQSIENHVHRMVVPPDPDPRPAVEPEHLPPPKVAGVDYHFEITLAINPAIIYKATRYDVIYPHGVNVPTLRVWESSRPGSGGFNTTAAYIIRRVDRPIESQAEETND